MRGAGGRKTFSKKYEKENIPLGSGCAGSSAREFRVSRQPPARPPAGRSPGEPPSPSSAAACWAASVGRSASPPPPVHPPAPRGVGGAASGRGLSGRPQPFLAPAAPRRRRLHNSAPGGFGSRRGCALRPHRAAGAAASNATCGVLPPAAVTLHQPERGLFLFRNQQPECL